MNDVRWEVYADGLSRWYPRTVAKVIKNLSTASRFVPKLSEISEGIRAHVSGVVQQRASQAGSLGPDSERSELIAAIGSRIDNETTGSGDWVYAQSYEHIWLVHRDSIEGVLGESLGRFRPLISMQPARIFVILREMKWQADGEVIGFAPGRTTLENHVNRIARGEIKFRDDQRRDSYLKQLKAIAKGIHNGVDGGHKDCASLISSTVS
jgi:hypothetical protein